MKRFLAMAVVGAMAFSAAACGNGKKTDPPEQVAAVDEAKDEEEENVEEIITENQEETNETDDDLFGLTYEIPEGWSDGNGGDYIWIAPGRLGNRMFFQVFDGDAGDDFSVMGVGRFTSQVEGTEPEEIKAFEAGSHIWHGFSIVFPGYFGPVKYVLLASNVDKNGKSIGTWIDLGPVEEPDFTLESEEIMGILESAEFLY